MKPQKLTLTGFVGIRKGLGRDSITIDFDSIPQQYKLVTIVGPNGKGKTTVLDNMHPYRMMPSRSTTLGPGGFSFWDHLCTPVAEKDLTWEHDGVSYRSVFSFKVRGAKKVADYFLFQKGVIDWEPYANSEGALSDGKADTYDRCLEAILGTPERFFTSQFSAQNRMALYEYGAGDVKALLASVLNLGLYRSLASKAGDVVKLLRSDLEQLQAELSQARLADDAIASTQTQLSELQMKEQQARSSRTMAEQGVTAAKAALASLEAQRITAAKDVEVAAFLRQQIDAANSNHKNVSIRFEQAANARLQEFGEEVLRLGQEESRFRQALTNMTRERSRVCEVIAAEAQIVDARVQAVELKERLEDAEAAISAKQGVLQALRPMLQKLQTLSERRVELNAIGSAKKITIQSLSETHALVEQVPCHGSGLQRSCKLLSQAYGAGQQLDMENKQLLLLRSEYSEILGQVKSLEQEVALVHVIEEELRSLNDLRKQLEEKYRVAGSTAARYDHLVQAKLRESELAAEVEQCNVQLQVIADRKHHVGVEVNKVQVMLARELSEADATHKVAVAQLSEQLAKLAAPIDPALFHKALADIEACARTLDASDQQLAKLASQKVSLNAKLQVHQEMKLKVQQVEVLADRIANEISKYKLLEKGLGNDGLIALSIDDAGPEISSLCNWLLQEDYERRFTVRLDTQRELQSGAMKETFVIQVFDSRGGDPAPLDDMSGGERVWVNECLTRAIALYVSQTSGTRYETLFTDEADGALDPGRKRQFMQMKMAVLQRGAYKREYFISQTPELWEFADHVIDLTTV